MLNLIKNPNINSTHLFRADILYDSHGTLPCLDQENERKSSSNSAQEHGILEVNLPNFKLQRTIVRKLIPRNAQLDRPLIQTCHYLTSTDIDTNGITDENTLVLYLPHASTPTEIPHYHPAVHGIAFLHTWPCATTSAPSTTPETPPPHPPTGLISIHYALFPTTPPPPPPPLPLPPRLHRTAHQLLLTLHKHGTGTQSGYVKRVHHDQLIPQARLQDTYAALKARHARRLIDNWAEHTPPSKHVFEDLGIAAFLIELWRDLYGGDAREGATGFPGFVDIGCGNGVLVDVLSREGYVGWGFDARRRKTWGTFGADVRGRLRTCVLVPKVVWDLGRDRMLPGGGGGGGGDGDGDFDAIEGSAPGLALAPAPAPAPAVGPSMPPPASDHHDDDPAPPLQFHNGLFPPATFVISNHADELTPWTPLLASLSRSAFLAIPCCSHDLSGARSRAHVPVSSSATDEASGKNDRSGPEKGDLTSLRANAKQPSAYASLVAWVESLAREVGFVVEREVLRIPSTRNVGVVGRFVGVQEEWKSEGREGVKRRGEREGREGSKGKEDKEGRGEEAREEKVREIVRREGGAVGWVERAVALAAPGSGKARARAH